MDFLFSTCYLFYEKIYSGGGPARPADPSALNHQPQPPLDFTTGVKPTAAAEEELRDDLFSAEATRSYSMSEKNVEVSSRVLEAWKSVEKCSKGNYIIFRYCCYIRGAV